MLWQRCGQNASWNNVTLIGSLASILGLLITLYVAWAVSLIEQSYVRQALLPKYISSLKRILKNLDQGLGAKDNQALRSRLSEARELLRAVARHFPKKTNAGKLVISITDSFEASERHFLLKAEEIIAELNGEVQAIDVLKAEMEWRRRDAT
jgi:5-bromo-4-chloroindolyl phosphate hydrolysis protein